MASFPQLTLYRANGSCAFIPHSVLRELGIPFTAVRMTMGAGGLWEAADGTLSHAEYRRTVNALGVIPSLKVEEADGAVAVITEMPAVLTYIASLAPTAGDAQHIAGKTAVARALAVSWLAFLSGQLHGRGYGALWRPRRYVDGARYPDAEKLVIAGSRVSIAECYALIEGRLPAADAGFALGTLETQPSLVDFNVYLFYRWGVENGFAMDTYPRYTRLARAMETRGSVKKAIEVEELDFKFPV
ncbi:hypothetical protein B0T26DRAFT_782208 [Lasiosphaeria miniovina]|uniref:Glutathione S-transferase n=1 Tax=Lasiosphaeria miniovina TaxID=1954250 RepID=A0AA40ACS7_9PEZI|nr:uncharacterized protein B0T26DRAFT_782208 [Lasiosphaeria miniovina]KAK0713410.1 hypothetical protein B0T26DRAFT_782208 [Lasiosphaeria miniovina]